jgi:hypothetical protein
MREVPSARRVAAMRGRAVFLEPPTVSGPWRGEPPRTTSLSIDVGGEMVKGLRRRLDRESFKIRSSGECAIFSIVRLAGECGCLV